MDADYSKEESPKILIVDDISMNVEILDNIITHEGYETLCALNVKEAIDLMKETKPSLILSDLSMPEIDGLEFCRMLKSDPATREIPFVFISVMDSSEEKKSAFLAGAVDFIPKPFDPIEVIMRVQNHLSSYQLKQEMANYNRRMHKLVSDQKKQVKHGQENILNLLVEILSRKNAGLGRHLESVGTNCHLLAQGLQFVPHYENEVTDEFIDNMKLAAMLHEVGSLVLPENAACRNARLEGADIESQKAYAMEGAGILQKISSGQGESTFLSMAVRIAENQYANWDGSGYPAAKGWEIPLEARIIAAVNDFDERMQVQLKEARAGSEPAGANEALEEPGRMDLIEESIRQLGEKSGVWYEPEIIEVLGRIRRRLVF